MKNLIDEKSRMVDVKTGKDSADQSFKKSNTNGWMTLDVRMESTVEDHGVRSGIRNSFENAVAHLTGLTSKEKRGKLIQFLNNELTTGNQMPQHGEDMLKKLNEQYLETIVKKCEDILNQNSRTHDPLPLASYVAVPLTGQDYYCIGDQGELYCYHNFGLTIPYGAGTGELFSVSYGGETCPVCLVCIGPAKD